MGLEYEELTWDKSDNQLSTAGKRKGSGCQNLSLSWGSANRKVSDNKSAFH